MWRVNRNGLLTDAHTHTHTRTQRDADVVWARDVQSCLDEEAASDAAWEGKKGEGEAEEGAG